MSWKTLLVVVLFVVAVVAGIVLTLRHRRVGQGSVTLGGRTVRVAVAQTDAAREQGLSGRDPLGENEGMLFLFPVASRYSFWMKDMRFPIDILWISGDAIADMSLDAAVPVSGQELPRYRPVSSVDKVLEVRAGFAQAAGLKIGDKVDIRIDR